MRRIRITIDQCDNGFIVTGSNPYGYIPSTGISEPRLVAQSWDEAVKLANELRETLEKEASK